jgi:hypothetical protein
VHVFDIKFKALQMQIAERGGVATPVEI